MPITLPGRESLDVSGSFDNCFFHTLAAHLIANNSPFPKDLFTFSSVSDTKSYAMKLQKEFPDFDSFSLFAEFSKRAAPDQLPLASTFIVEKTLVLGFLLREWFATQMAKNPKIGEELQAEVLIKFKTYKEFRNELSLSSSELLSGPEGVLYLGNKDFLEYFTNRSEDGWLSTSEQKVEKFEKYFTDNANDTDKALLAYWQLEGYQNYCRQFAITGTKLAENDVIHGIKLMNQPVVIYPSGNIEKPNHIQGNKDLAKMEIVLDAQVGHYYLLKTEKTKNVLDEYQKNWANYLADREAVLQITDNKVKAAHRKPSLFTAAICKSEHIDIEIPPFELLLEKVVQMRQFIIDFDGAKTLAKQKEKMAEALRQKEEQHQKELAEQEEKMAEALRQKEEQYQKDLEEQQKKEAEKLQQKENLIRKQAEVRFAKIDAVLNTLSNKIGEVEQHHFPQAVTAATDLLALLQKARDEYHVELQQLDANAYKAAQKFKNSCESSIRDAQSVLERDLGWGDYLLNLLKTLVNAVIWFFTAGQKNSFFPYVKAASIESVEQAEIDLEESQSEFNVFG